MQFPISTNFHSFSISSSLPLDGTIKIFIHGHYITTCFDTVSEFIYYLYNLIFVE